MRAGAGWRRPKPTDSLLTAKLACGWALWLRGCQCGAVICAWSAGSQRAMRMVTWKQLPGACSPACRPRFAKAPIYLSALSVAAQTCPATADPHRLRAACRRHPHRPPDRCARARGRDRAARAPRRAGGRLLHAPAAAGRGRAARQVQGLQGLGIRGWGLPMRLPPPGADEPPDQVQGF